MRNFIGMDRDIRQVIASIEKRNRNYRLFWAAFLFLTGLSLSAYPLLYRIEAAVFWFFCGVVFMLTALLLLAYALRVFPFRQAGITGLLDHGREQVVWIYPYIMQTMPFGIKLFDSTRLYFHLLNGENQQLYCRTREANELMEELRMYFPRACFGYSQEKEFMYEYDPAMLLRNTSDKE